MAYLEPPNPNNWTMGRSQITQREPCKHLNSTQKGPGQMSGPSCCYDTNHHAHAAPEKYRNAQLGLLHHY